MNTDRAMQETHWDSYTFCMIEYAGIPSGISAADAMVKSSAIVLHKAAVIYPGRYIAIFSGEMGAVKTAVELSYINHPAAMLDCILIGRPHPLLAEFLTRAGGEVFFSEGIGALGILETTGAASCVLAADYCLKAAQVDLMSINFHRGMSGKAYLMISGSVANVSAALESAGRNMRSEDVVEESSVIPNPDVQIWESLKGMTEI